jgi:CheY-like chemotaxis protein
MKRCRGLNEMRILIIEDNEIPAELAQMVLTAGGYQVDHAAEGSAGLLRMIEHPPPLIIQDLHLPDIGGTGLLRRLRNLPGGSDVPILAFG